MELVLRGRLGYTGGYRISEIEIYNEDNIEYTNTPEEQKALDTITERLIASYLSDIPDDKILKASQSQCRQMVHGRILTIMIKYLLMAGNRMAILTD